MNSLNKMKLWIIAVLVLFFSACNSWLDVDLENRVEEQDLFSKASGFQKALAAVYSQMASESLYGYQLSYGTLDVMGQLYDYSKLPTNWDYIKELNYRNSDFRSLTGSWWTNLYATIESLNNIMRWSEKNAAILSEDELGQIRGETLGLRAYLYFDLVRLFAPDVKVKPDAERIPYNTQFGVELPPLYTTKKVCELILEDLKAAEEYLKNDPIIGQKIYELKDDEKPFRNSADKYVARMNLYAVKALMARVYLDMNDYVNARIKANEVIQSGCFSLLKREELTTQADPNLKDMLFSDEHIFSLRNKDIPTSAQSVCITVNDQTQNVTLPLTGTYINNYDIPSKDIRWMEWFSDGGLSTRLVKYYKSKDNSTNYFPKIPLIRLSELYLMLSESYLEEDLQKAKDYADSVRVSRIGDEGKLTTFSENDFIKEMRREFPGEGQLFFMYKRRNHDILRDGAAASIPASEKIFMLLIPDAEIENGNVQQSDK